jgi:cytoplasmic iron level regulating protein YaaA (DUF328/UPF0246 family)
LRKFYSLKEVMLIVLSPAKTLDYVTPAEPALHSRPEFMYRAAELIAVLREIEAPALATLMKISDTLATLNVQRFHDWSTRVSRHNSKPAVLAFAGDVYLGLQADTLNAPQLDYLQAHLRILSGLYGVLRPLDLMQPYRLEMGTRLANPAGRDLYAFWGDTVTKALRKTLAQQPERTLVNLASEEYFRVVRPALLGAPVITPVFEEWKDTDYKVIGFFAKRARGAMTRYAAQHGVTQAEALKDFDVDGYRFAPAASDATTWRFRRKVPA